MSLANISIVGNLVRPPEQLCFPSGSVKTTMVVAVNGRNKPGRIQANNADFYRVETWGKLAELSSKYLSKGNQVTVTGRLVLDHWTDKHGKDRVTPIVEASQLAFPQRLRVAGDGEVNEPFSANPISGEIVVASDDDDEDEGDYEEICKEDDLERSDQAKVPSRGVPSTKIRAEPRRSKSA